MKLPHAHALFIHGSSRIHRIRAEIKILGLLVFAVLVGLTLPAWWIACASAAAALAALVHLAGLRFRTMARRLVLEVPFVAFALALPLIGGGERVEVLSVSLSTAGLWTLWSVLAKSTLCLGASIILTATTTIPDLLRGLRALRVPSVFVDIAGLMIRYLDVLMGQARRLKVAMASRGFGHEARRFAPVASGAGAMFMRTYERAERVQVAMASRGYGAPR